MVGERDAATALITAGALVWMWRLPDTTTSLSVWDAESEEALVAHLTTLPLYPYHEVEITGVGAHPAFPTALRASSLHRPAAGA